MNDIHIPIGTGDHVLDLMLGRPKNRARIILKSVPESDYILVTVVDDLEVVAEHRKVTPEDFRRFGHILDEMEKELLDRKERINPVSSQVGYLVDDHGIKTRVFG